MDYVTNEYEKEGIEYDCDDEEKIGTEISNTSWNEENQKIENESFKRNSLSIKERSSIIEELQKLFKERQELKLKNIYLQKQICNFLIKSKNLNAVEKITIDYLSIHSDYRYKQILDEYETFKIKLNDTSQENNHVIKQYENLYDSRIADFNFMFEKLKLKLSEINFKIESLKYKETKDCVLDLLSKLEKRLDILTDIRIKYFKLEYTYKQLQSFIKTQIQLPEQYSFIDYENLKIMKSIRADKYEKNQTDLKIIQEKLNSIIKVLIHVKQASDVVINKIQMVEAQLIKLHSIENKQRMELIKIKKLYYSKQKMLNELRELKTLLTWKSEGKLLHNFKK